MHAKSWALGAVTTLATLTAALAQPVVRIGQVGQSPICGGSGTNSMVVDFRAPVDGMFVFRTVSTAILAGEGYVAASQVVDGTGCGFEETPKENAPGEIKSAVAQCRWHLYGGRTYRVQAFTTNGNATNQDICVSVIPG
jgi:hypothetical protein